MDFTKDYYAILGVEPKASKREIKASYRSLARQHHPDTNPDDEHAGERFTEINLANEILSNDISRAIYDEYYFAARQSSATLITESSLTSENERGKRYTYTKQTTVQTEKRVYFRGTLIVKYCAEKITAHSDYTSIQTDYRIHPVQVHVHISDTDIYSYPGTPQHLERSYSEADVFLVPLEQPVKCSIGIAGRQEYYRLTLLGMRIKDPIISDVAKHDNESLATLSAEMYAYTSSLEDQIVYEQITVFQGPTGSTATKTEGDYCYAKDEYFHADGSTFWGPWYKKNSEPDRDGTIRRRATSEIISFSGCLQYGWIIPILFLGVLFPRIFPALLALILISWLINLVDNVLQELRPLFIGLGLLFIGFVFYDAVYKRNIVPGLVSGVKEKRGSITTREHRLDSSNAGLFEEYLIAHHVRWRDYSNTVYDIDLSIRRSDVYTSAKMHKQLPPPPNNSLASIYSELVQFDERAMQPIFAAFDSVGTARRLSKSDFAQMVVSCIQSMPYFLVLEGACEAQNYQNSFIRSYLQKCDRDCCVSEQKFGVRSPAEFFSDLKGDCDTRAVIIYAVLKHFDYDVAIITSQFYEHAMVAVALPGKSPDNSVSIHVGGKNYLLWETTQPGFAPGDIPQAYSDVDKWTIDLLHEKTNI